MSDSGSPPASPPTLGKSLSRVLKISGRKTPKDSSSHAGSPDKNSSGSLPDSKSPRKGLTKRSSVAGGLSSSAPPPARGGKGIESIQKLVSKNKRRFVDKEHGFNLDLSYIGERIIAMGFPSEGKEAAYRNPMSEVQRFLETFHKGHYKVYNLCSERAYDASSFPHVARYPFDDHNAPPLHLIYECCRDIDAWMKDNPKNVACIHCKAGKGRTGVIIASWLQYNNEWPDADKALAFYAAARTHNQKGVTIPSQIRYVRYFGSALKRKGGFNEPPPPKTILLKELTFRDFVSPGELKFTVQAHGISTEPSTLRVWKDVGTSLSSPASRKESQDLAFALHPPLPLFGDICISVSGKPVAFHFWLSTAMMEGTSLTLQKSELDKANKDKKKIFPPGFNVTLVYAEETKAGVAVASSKPSLAGKENLRRKNEIAFPTLMNL